LGYILRLVSDIVRHQTVIVREIEREHPQRLPESVGIASVQSNIVVWVWCRGTMNNQRYRAVVVLRDRLFPGGSPSWGAVRYWMELDWAAVGLISGNISTPDESELRVIETAIVEVIDRGAQRAGTHKGIDAPLAIE